MADCRKARHKVLKLKYDNSQQDTTFYESRTEILGTQMNSADSSCPTLSHVVSYGVLYRRSNTQKNTYRQKDIQSNISVSTKHKFSQEPVK